jgi:hypothetical protein
MLVFCLALQTPLERTQGMHPNARVLAYADDCYLQGRPDHVIPSFHTLGDLAAGIDLQMQLPQCSASGWDVTAVDEVAQELHICDAPDDLLVCGTPLGTTAFVAMYLERQATQACGLLDALFALPLSAQDT